MKIADYPGLYGKWPPPARDSAGALSPLDHTLDTLVFASLQASGDPQNAGVRMLTIHNEVLSMREFTGMDEIFALLLCDFLNKHRGKSIRDIGQIEASCLV